jgi:hypothetical protein
MNPKAQKWPFLCFWLFAELLIDSQYSAKLAVTLYKFG